MASQLASLRKAVRSVTGAADLFRAARRAGASTADAADVIRISTSAVRIALSAHGGVPGQQNAIRHFIWQACLAARHGTAVAEAVAQAQEHGRHTPEDTRVDLLNNAVGRAYGTEHAAEIRRGTVVDALRALVPVAKAKFAANELIWVDDQ